MNRKQQIVLVVAAALLSAAWWQQNRISTADEKEKPAAEKEKKESSGPKKVALKTFMRKKLEASQKILEGLTTEDYDLIGGGAKQLAGISAAADFVVSNDPLYTQHADEFRRIVAKLEKRAKEKRLDSAALAYVDLTLSCIECHKFARDVLIADVTP